MFLWNFVNLLDAEGGWLARLAALLVGAFVGTRILGYLFEKMSQQFEGHHLLLQKAFIRALYKPLAALIWFFVLLYSVNLVTDRYFSERFSEWSDMLIRVVLVFFAAWFLLRWKHSALIAICERRPVSERGKVHIMGKLLTAAICIMTFFFLMEATGQSVQTLLAFGGISGLALAIASQEIIANFFGGLMIFINRPFEEQEQISLPSSNFEGTVQEIGWYQTELLGSDQRPIYVPNSLFTKAYVINTTRASYRKIEESVTLRQEDLPLMPKIIKQVEAFLKAENAIEKQEKVLVYIGAVSPHFLELTFSAHCTLISDAQFYPYRDQVLLMVSTLIEENGAKIENVPPITAERRGK